MRIRLALLVAALAPAAAFARDLAPGTWQLSASTTLGYSRQSSDTAGTSSTLWLETEGLYHVANNVAVGLGVSGARSSYALTALGMPGGITGTTTIHVTTTTLQIGPALAWRVPLSDRVSFLARGSVHYVRIDSSFDTASPTGYSAALGAGVSWFVVDHVSFDATLAYQRTHVAPNVVPTDSDTITALVGVSLFLGGT